MKITPDQIRAGLGLIGKSQSDMAEATGITSTTISQYLRPESDKTVKISTQEAFIKYIEDHNAVFIEGGVKRATDNIQIIDGEDCYLKTLDRVILTLLDLEEESRELLIMFASDSVSPSEVNNKYRIMRKNGIKMRQLIEQGDTYIMGELEEYRTIPSEHFINIVSLVYGDYTAQVNGSGTAVTIYHDPEMVRQKRTDFEDRWAKGAQPHKSTAEERF